MSFHIIEDLVSGDFAFEARGESLEELFSSSAEACFYAMTDLDKVDASTSRSFDVEAGNIDDLLFSFLAELIYLKDTEKLFFSKFQIKIDGKKCALNAVARGERIDYNKHEIKTDVKAVTYHGLCVKQEEGTFKVRIILDL